MYLHTKALRSSADCRHSAPTPAHPNNLSKVAKTYLEVQQFHSTRGLVTKPRKSRSTPLCREDDIRKEEEKIWDSPLVPSSQSFSKGAKWVAGFTSPTGEGGKADTVDFWCCCSIGMLGTGSRKAKKAVSPHTSLLILFAILVPSSQSLLHLSFHQHPGTMAAGYWTRCKTCFLKVPQPLTPCMTVCLKSSSRSLGKKQSIRSQVISQRSEYPVRESALWNIPAVSITSSIFFRDSGMASSCNQRHSSGHRE